MRRSALALCALLATATGCGGDDEPLRTVTIGGAQQIRIEGDEYRFDPGRVIVTRGGPLNITFANEGSLAHNLTVFDGERRVAGLRSFPPGEERTLRVDAPRGAYRLVCTVADHEELGMVGELDLRR